MENKMISEKLKTIILKEIDLEDFDFQDTTTAPEVPGWDSLSHVNIITAVEKAYNIRFKTYEILKFKTVGDLQCCINSKVGEIL